jgi:hypothetical protein
MAQISTQAEENERSKAEKARKTNASSPWHTYSTDQLQLSVFTALQVIFQETPNTALLGLQLGLAADWHIADEEAFANQGAFLRNWQEGARLHHHGCRCTGLQQGRPLACAACSDQG